MNTYVETAKEFRKSVLSELNFLEYQEKYCNLYTNPLVPKPGYFLLYERQNYYELGIADYTIPHPFSIQFNNSQRLIRFGTVYKGITEFQLENEPISSFHPSSFFVVEEGIKGTQMWHTGQHFHGIEVTIYEDYFTKVINPLLKTTFDFSSFIKNHTYHYLPLEVISILQTMQALSNKNMLDPLQLESYILQCISKLLHSVEDSSTNVFTTQLDYGKIKIGTDRYLQLTAQDIKCIQEAHNILSQQIEAPPTIEKLSELVGLHPQKLKAGFSHYYHLSIGEFTTSLRMSIAANLLSTTELSISDIAKRIGYHYPSNFIKAFKKTFGCTPLQYKHKRTMDLKKI
ncbi:MAG: AraC family transcriptional regulator [Turicibacter sp.]|nr:AraC family transcriptional regulator [Turicibacter sp.]